MLIVYAILLTLAVIFMAICVMLLLSMYPCFFLGHAYVKAGVTHGMHIDGKGGLVGTERRLFKCVTCDEYSKPDAILVRRK